MLHYARLLLWRAAALLALGLGIVGIALPVLPTVPFLILAAWAASKGSPALERWLLTHPKFGGHIRRWRERGVVPRRAKWFATVAMLMSSIIMQFTHAPMWARIAGPALMFAIAIWLWRRPEE